MLIIMPIKKPNNGASQPSSDLRQASLYAALLLGYTIHFIYCIWGNLRITVAELIAAANGYRQWLLAIAGGDRSIAQR